MTDVRPGAAHPPGARFAGAGTGVAQIPTATYRLQLTPSFGFAAAAGLAPYLADLGVSHVYLSPILRAAPGSQHGYDVYDHTAISAELGGEAGLRALVAELRAHRLGVVVDIVPNHMAMPNPLAESVLEHGAASPYAGFFDLDGERPDPARPNYRRFFDISGLIALRQEDPAVFEHTHRLLLGLVAEGLIDGLRVDHPDGLTDPAGYFRTLAARAPGAWIVAEKILARGERLPADWPVAGTTGYDALRLVCGLFVDPRGERPLTALFTRFTGGPAEFGPVGAAARRHQLDHGLAPELRRLLAVTDLPAADVIDLLVALPVYRTYVVPGRPPAAVDRELLHRLATPEVAKAALGGEPEFTRRLQQTSAALAAKGVEDTAFYRWPRFVALNEVGGDPAAFGVGVAEFHARARLLPPATMTTLGTHDTKRQEDVRARLAVLSELPAEWAGAVAAWRGGGTPLEPELEYLVWQNLLGAWPISLDRALAFVTKAMRETKLRTSWTAPDPGYEAAVAGWLRERYADPAWQAGLAGFAARLAPCFRANVLGQKLVQLTMPGVPDVYQGAELTDLALVDPDNRRPVDFARRRALLDRRPGDLDGEKLLVTARALRLRRARPDWFAGPHEPVGADEHLVAFRRGGALPVATRLPYRLAARGGWTGQRLAIGPGRWRDELTGRSHGRDPLVGEVLAELPVALLVRLG